MRNITWNTHKTPEGFAFRVYEVIGSTIPDENGHYAKFVTLQTGVRRTRAQAKGLAQRWCRYLRTQEAA